MTDKTDAATTSDLIRLSFNEGRKFPSMSKGTLSGTFRYDAAGTDVTLLNNSFIKKIVQMVFRKTISVKRDIEGGVNLKY